MSVEAITWALGSRVERSSAKFVLVAMANCANSDMTCWPSLKYLSDATEQDRKTVIENMKRLKEAGFIEPTGEHRGSTGQVVVYRMNVAQNETVKEARKRTSTENGPVPKTDDKRPVFPVKEARFSRLTGPKTGYGTVMEPSLNPKETDSDAAIPQLPPAFSGDANLESINPKARVLLSAAWELPAAWGLDAESLGWQTGRILKEAEKYRQYWISGKGNGTRRSLKGWRQSWSNWLNNAERYEK